MDRESNQDKVMRAFAESVRPDRAKTNVTKISELGLVEMTRKRTRESLGRMLTEPCFYCDGKGYLKSKTTVAYEVLRQIRREGGAFADDVLVVSVHPEIGELLATADNEYLEALEKRLQNFIQVLSQIWWRLDRSLDAASLRAAARFYVAQALLAGTTTLVDHHESPRLIAGSLDVLADACAELGCRALLTYGATERNGGAAEGQAGLAECQRFVEHNQRRAILGLVGLHASFTVSDETIRAAGELCRALSVPMHVHVAEDRADVEDAQRRGYRDPLDRLLRLRALPAGSIVAHGVHLDDDAVRRCADEGLWLVQNPRSNHGNRVGYPRSLHVIRDGWHSGRTAIRRT
jgi:hypothetical protein